MDGMHGAKTGGANGLKFAEMCRLAVFSAPVVCRTPLNITQ